MISIRSYFPEYFTNSDAYAFLSMRRCTKILSDDMARDGFSWAAETSGAQPSHVLDAKVKSDAMVYYYVINSWCCITADVSSEKSAKALAAILDSYGLIRTIQDAENIASAIRATDDAWYLESVPQLEYTGLWQSVLDCGGMSAVQLLQILNYPKRFSCAYRNEILEEDSYQKFLAINTRHNVWRVERGQAYGIHASSLRLKAATRGRIDHSGDLLRFATRVCLARDLRVEATLPSLPTYWLTEIRECAMMLYHGHGKSGQSDIFSLQRVVPTTITDPYRYDIGEGEYGYFSTGHFQDSSNGISKRCRYMESNLTYKGYQLVPWDIPNGKLSGASKVLSVPKSWKARRMIAEENAYTAYSGQAVNRYIQERLKAQWHTLYRRRYDPSLQERNRLLATLGSATGKRATIDLSGASDSISNVFAQLILPPDVYTLISSVRSSKLLVNGKMLTNHILLTSGTGLTFDTESNVFICIAAAVERVYARWTGKRVALSVTIGDDLVVDTQIFTLLCEVLAMCGFVVNIDKSFGSTTAYRESCGIEAFGGYSFQLLYYPRSGIEFAEDSLDNAVTKLCALQRAMYWDFPEAAAFTRGLVLDMCPRMTHTAPNDPDVGITTDLLGRDDLNPVTYPPHWYDGREYRDETGLTPELREVLCSKMHVTVESVPDVKAYKAWLKEAQLNIFQLENIERMRYIEELRRLRDRVYPEVDGEYVVFAGDYNGHNPEDELPRNPVMALGFVKTRLVLS